MVIWNIVFQTVLLHRNKQNTALETVRLSDLFSLRSKPPQLSQLTQVDSLYKEQRWAQQMLLSHSANPSNSQPTSLAILASSASSWLC